MWAHHTLLSFKYWYAITNISKKNLDEYFQQEMSTQHVTCKPTHCLIMYCIDYVSGVVIEIPFYYPKQNTFLDYSVNILTGDLLILDDRK